MKSLYFIIELPFPSGNLRGHVDEWVLVQFFCQTSTILICACCWRYLIAALNAGHVRDRLKSKRNGATACNSIVDATQCCFVSRRRKRLVADSAFVTRKKSHTTSERLLFPRMTIELSGSLFTACPMLYHSIKSTSRLLAFYLFAATEFYSVISYPILYLYPISFYIFLHFSCRLPYRQRLWRDPVEPMPDRSVNYQNRARLLLTSSFMQRSFNLFLSKLDLLNRWASV